MDIKRMKFQVEYECRSRGREAEEADKPRKLSCSFSKAPTEGCVNEVVV
jgi:hypothetical protein